MSPADLKSLAQEAALAAMTRGGGDAGRVGHAGRLRRSVAANADGRGSRSLVRVAGFRSGSFTTGVGSNLETVAVCSSRLSINVLRITRRAMKDATQRSSKTRILRPLRDLPRRTSWTSATRRPKILATDKHAALDAGRACCAGKGRPRRAPALRARLLGAGAEPQRPDRSSRATGSDASSRARPDPVRAHAGVPVRLLPRRGVSHGGRPRGWAADGIARPALRRRAPLELRHLRRTGSEARLQPQRLRRDAAGTFRVGREAARRQPRGRRPGPGLRRCDPPLDRDGGRARVPRSDERASRRCGISTSGTRASMSSRSATSLGRGYPARR